MTRYRNLVIFRVENISYVIISHFFNFIRSPAYENYFTQTFQYIVTLHSRVKRYGHANGDMSIKWCVACEVTLCTKKCGGLQ